MENQPLKIIILDVETTLAQIEAIFAKYISISPELIFVKHLRYPISGKERINLDMYFDKHLVSHTPWLAYLCLGCVTDVLKSMVYREGGEASLFVSNPLMEKESMSFIDASDLDYIESIIMGYLPNATKNEIVLIFNCIKNIYTQLEASLFPAYINHIIKFDITGQNIIVIVVEHIKTYRFNEAIFNATGDDVIEKSNISHYVVTDIRNNLSNMFICLSSVAKQYDVDVEIIKTALRSNTIFCKHFSIRASNIL